MLQIQQSPYAASQMFLLSAGFKLKSRGKVRDTFEPPFNLLPEILQLASDRVSIFDFILPAEVPDKGAILTALALHWFRRLAASGISHHVVAYGASLAKKFACFQQCREVLARSILVKRLDMIPYEAVVRGYLLGSAWQSYRETGQVFGQEVPKDSKEGDRLDMPLFTPTTKAESGHDLPVSVAEVEAQYPGLTARALDTYVIGEAEAANRGVIIADTKFEFDKHLVLADEALTPDSSRFWNRSDYILCRRQGQLPPSLDKQIVRDWGLTVETPKGRGLNKLNPADLSDQAFVSELSVPEALLQKTSHIYHQLFTTITGMHLLEFQMEFMNI